MERISSRQNAVVKRFRDLARAAAGVDEGQHADVLLDGEHLLQEAVACNIPVDIAAFSDRYIDAAHAGYLTLAAELETRGARVVAVSDQVLTAISPVQHPSGVVAIARAPTGEVSVVMATLTELPLVIVLAGLQDPGNVGAIIRAAAAFGASGVVAIEGSANPFGWKALRGAMGGTFRLPVAARGTLADVVSAAGQSGRRLVAAVPRGGTPLPHLDLRTPTAVIFGGEGAGVTQDTLAAVVERVTIPMQSPVESLNVSIAAALVLYEATRQRAAPRGRL